MPLSLPASASRRHCSSKRRIVTIVSYMSSRVLVSGLDAGITVSCAAILSSIRYGR